MAGIDCQNGDGNAAIFIGTMLENGTSITVCSQCLSGFCAALLTEFTGAPVGEFVTRHLESLEHANEPEHVEPDPEYDTDWVEAHRDEIELALESGHNFNDAVLLAQANEAKTAVLADHVDSPAN